MILVTDGEQRSTLAVVRSLGRAGHEVGVCSARRKPLAAASRHCRIARLVPDPAADAQGFVQAVERIVDEEGVNLLIPMTDLSAPLVLRLRERRPELVIPFPDLEAYEAVSDKSRLVQIAAELGVPVPRQVVVGRREDAHRVSLTDEVGDRVGWPAILKPARSVVHAGGAAQKLSVRRALAPDALITELTRYPPEAYPLLIQERIVGPGLGAFLMGDAQGKLLASFAHRRLREKPPTGGVSVYRESVPLRDDLRAYSEQIMAHFRWSGVLMLEFKEDTSTGIPYLMEANARFWGSLQLAVDAGVDFPRLLVDSVLGAEVPPVTTYRLGVRSRWLWGDFDHLLWILRAPRSYRAVDASLPGRMRAIGCFLVPWRPGERPEVLRWGDPRPFFRETVQWLASSRRGLARR